MQLAVVMQVKPTFIATTEKLTGFKTTNFLIWKCDGANEHYRLELSLLTSSKSSLVCEFGKVDIFKQRVDFMTKKTYP